MTDKNLDLPLYEGYYYSLEDIAKIILTDMKQMEEAIKNREEWDEEFLSYLDNPIIINGEKRYYIKIIAMFDKLINDKNKSRYKRNYQLQIHGVLFKNEKLNLDAKKEYLDEEEIKKLEKIKKNIINNKD